MTINQISVFVENSPGMLRKLTDTLAQNQINMRAMSLAETSDFGIARVIVDDLDKSVQALKAEGYVYTVTPVLGVAVPDEPGGLNRVLAALSGVNVEYMYAFLGGHDAQHAYMIFHVQNNEAAVEALARQGIECLKA